MADGDAGILPRIIQSVANLRHRTNSAATDVSARHRINWVDTATFTWTITDSSVNDELSVSGTGAAPYTLPSAVPLGTLGYAQATASQNTITTVVDLTSLTVTVTVGASRRIRITVFVPAITTASDSGYYLSIKESATVLQKSAEVSVGGSNGVFGVASVVLTPSTGSHTYKATLENQGGTAVNAVMAATSPGFILVEDIGT